MNISGKLIQDCIKTQPSLKEKTITDLAIQLCQNVRLKECIIFETELLRRQKYSVRNSTWDALIAKRSKEICEELPLPSTLKDPLVVRIQPIALQLYSWNRQQVMFDLSPLFGDSLLTPSDWTVKMRLNEKMIAERLVLDERIPVYQRYRMACVYCLEVAIYSLWDKIPPEQHEDLCHYNESKLVLLWSYQLAGKIEELIPTEDSFWYYLLKNGLIEGSKLTVFHSWEKLCMILRREILIDASLEAAYQIYRRSKEDFLMYFEHSLSSAPFCDILFFLLTQMSDNERFVFFQKSLQETDHNVLICFIQWPYMDILLPIINDLWSILPEVKYGEILLTLAANYSDEFHYSTGRNGYVNNIYGDLIIELLKKSPDHLKRHVFSGIYLNNTNTNIFGAGNLLYAAIKKVTHNSRNLKIFQQIWKYITLEEKQIFLRSEFGESVCCHLALEQNWEILDSVLKECLPEDKIAMFKKQILRSVPGKNLCFEMLMVGNKERLNSWLNWGFTSKPEIFSFILKLFFKDHRIDLKEIGQIGIKIDCLDYVLETYSPSEEARRKFKTRFVKIYSRYVCIHFVVHLKWREMDQFLIWGFPSEDYRKRFKKWFVKEHAMFLCEYHMKRWNFEDADHFLTWCFPSADAKENFRQEFFFFSGVEFQWNIFACNWEDTDGIIKWFRMSSEAIRKFKKEVLFRSYCLSALFNALSNFEKYHKRKKEYSDYMLQRVASFLRWGLADEETVVAFKSASKIYLTNFSFSNDEVRRWVQKTWDKLLSDISLERKHETY